MKKRSLQHEHYLLRKSLSGQRKGKGKASPRNNASAKTRHDDYGSNYDLDHNKYVPTRSAIPSGTVVIPTVFRLDEANCEESIRVVNQVKSFGAQGRDVYIKMDKVRDIGQGAIAMLLSVLEELRAKGIQFRGKKPKERQANILLERSGFFKYVTGLVDPENLFSKNNILVTGVRETDQTRLAGEISKAMETIWGKSGRSPNIYSCIVEMMRNTNDHAYKKDSAEMRWHLATTHETDRNSVHFSFVDNGSGIISSLKSRWWSNIGRYFQNPIDLLESAYRGKVESITGIQWRGKGLPTIFETFEENTIAGLVVITNDAYIDFGLGIKKELRHKFQGTYYYWRIDTTCNQEIFQ